jgi:hypothetical protein
LRDRIDPLRLASGARRIVHRMVRAQHTYDTPRPGPAALSRRNRAEGAVRERLARIDDLYVLRSSWYRNGAGPEPLVAVIARTDDARNLARRELADIAGLPDQAWQEAWKRLSLGDWMIWVFPERATA